MNDRIPESEQYGWNQGYIAGEAERIALATANCDLRSDLLAARHRIVELGGCGCLDCIRTPLGEL